MHTPKAGANGFSLVEVVVAMVVLTFGLLAMAASTGYVYNQLRNTGFDTQRMLAKQQVVEQLRGMFWADISTTAVTRTVGRYTITHQWSGGTSVVKSVRIITSGPAYYGINGATRTIGVDTMRIEIVKPK